MTQDEAEIRQAVEDYYQDGIPDPPDWTTAQIRVLLAIIDDLRTVAEEGL